MNPIVFAVMLGTLLTSLVAPVDTTRKEHAMSQYLLILHDTPASFGNVSVDEMNAIIGEYMSWKEKITSEGRYVGSNKLADEGGRRLVSVDGTVRVSDGPYAEAKEVIGGYFLIRAASYDEAVEVARTCPHLRYGGSIEIRAIDEMRDAASSGR